MKRTSLSGADCPVARSLDAIGDWWSLLIVRDAFDGIRRFKAFQENLGIAKGMLSGRLRHLVHLGVLATVPASDGTAYKEYVLTDKGRALFVVVVSLRQWGEDHCFDGGEAHSVMLEKSSGNSINRLELRSRDGRTLSSADTRVQKVSLGAN